MKKYGFLTLILCLFCLGEAAVASPGKADAAPAAQAQSSKLTVKGFVKDDKGDPMIGVTLIVKGTNFGTVSNADGSYSIDVPYGGATLMVSYIGYAPQEINVNNRTKIDITLLEDSKALEEVVVVGYNVQKKETITGKEFMKIFREMKGLPQEEDKESLMPDDTADEKKASQEPRVLSKENNEAKDDTSIAEDSQSKAAIVSDDMFEE